MIVPPLNRWGHKLDHKSLRPPRWACSGASLLSHDWDSWVIHPKPVPGAGIACKMDTSRHPGLKKFTAFNFSRSSTRCDGCLHGNEGWGCSQFTTALHIVTQNGADNELLMTVHLLEFCFLAGQKVRFSSRFAPSFPGVLCGAGRAHILLVFRVVVRVRRAAQLRGWTGGPWLFSWVRSGTLEPLSGSWPCGYHINSRVLWFTCRGGTLSCRLGRMIDVPGRFHDQSEQETPVKTETPSLGAGAVQFPQSHDHDPLGLCADLHVTACFETTPRQTVKRFVYPVFPPLTSHRHGRSARQLFITSLTSLSAASHDRGPPTGLIPGLLFQTAVHQLVRQL